MLRIPDNHKLNFTEIVCEDCDSDHYVSAGTPGRFCPYCGKASAYPNGDFNAYIKKHEPIIDSPEEEEPE